MVELTVGAPGMVSVGKIVADEVGPRVVVVNGDFMGCEVGFFVVFVVGTLRGFLVRLSLRHRVGAVI